MKYLMNGKAAVIGGGDSVSDQGADDMWCGQGVAHFVSPLPGPLSTQFPLTAEL